MAARHFFARIAAAAALLALAACGGSGDGESSLPGSPALTARDVPQPDGWDADIALRPVEDLNPDPAVVEISLEAKVADVELLPGTKTPAWTYNGTVPGPLIRARVGDKLVVHFKNSLPDPTTIHWHGV